VFLRDELFGTADKDKKGKPTTASKTVKKKTVPSANKTISKAAAQPPPQPPKPVIRPPTDYEIKQKEEVIV
jgi:hypothetical protein